MIIRTIQVIPSGPDATDDAPHLSRADPSGANRFDGVHLPTDLAVGFELPKLPTSIMSSDQIAMMAAEKGELD